MLKLATSLAKHGNVSWALRELMGLHKLFPANPHFPMAVASHQEELGSLLRARVWAAKATAITPSAACLQLQARVEGKLGYIDAARSLYAEASQAPDCSGSAVVAAWAEFEYEHGNLEEYHRLLLRVFELEPSSPAALQRLGTGLRRCRRFEEAREAFKAALEIDPTHAQSYQGWGVLEWQLGLVNTARRVFSDGVQHAPPHAALYSGWAHLEAGMQNVDMARKLWEKALEVDPSHGRSIRGLASLEDRASNHSRATELYVHGKDKRPSDHIITVSAAQQQFEQRNLERAVRILEFVLDNEPKDGVALHLMGTIHQQRNNLDAAAESFRQGIKLSGRKGALLCAEGLARLREFQGDHTEARRTFRAAEATWPPSARFLREWALFEKRRDELEYAAELFARAAHADPRDGRTWLGAALLARRREFYDEAEILFERASYTLSGDYTYHSWGTLRKGRKDLDGAREIFSRGLLLFPDSGALLLEQALLEAQCGHVDEARSFFQRGANLRKPHEPLLTAWATFEADLGCSDNARMAEQKLAAGARPVDPAFQRECMPHPKSWGSGTITDHAAPGREGPQEGGSIGEAGPDEPDWRHYLQQRKLAAAAAAAREAVEAAGRWRPVLKKRLGKSEWPRHVQGPKLAAVPREWLGASSQWPHGSQGSSEKGERTPMDAASGSEGPPSGQSGAVTHSGTPAEAQKAAQLPSADVSGQPAEPEGSQSDVSGQPAKPEGSPPWKLDWW